MLYSQVMGMSYIYILDDYYVYGCLAKELQEGNTENSDTCAAVNNKTEMVQIRT